jgi:Family of unknown function (DUF6228)
LLPDNVVVDMARIGEAGCLQFADVERGPGGEIEYARARLQVNGLEASMRVSSHYATGFDELVAIFRRLAAGWRGWHGEVMYESLEHDLRVIATHDGHIRLAVQLRQSAVPEGWSASAVIRLDPGEEMTRAAEAIAAVLSPSD